MKPKKSIFLALACVSLKGLLYAGEDPSLLIGPHHVGPIKVGMTATEAAKNYPANRTKLWQLYPSVWVLDLFAPGEKQDKPSLRMNLNHSQRIYSIEIHDRRYKTAKGISLGVTLGELRKAYPQITVGGEAGEMDQFIKAEVGDDGTKFYFKYDPAIWERIDQQPDPHHADPSIIPDRTPVTDILVT